MSAVRKLTRNQQIVHDALQRAAQPLSAYQILDDETVRSGGVKAPLTVYRAIDRLVAHGMVHRIESLNAFVLCDHDPQGKADHAPVAFMICTACKQTLEVAIEAAQDMIVATATAHNFSVNAVQIEISGLCSDCRA